MKQELGMDLYDTEYRCDLADRCTLCLCSQFLLAARKEGFMMNNQFVWQCIVFDALQHSEDDFMDMVANLGLRDHIAKQILRRGFTDIIGKNGLKFVGSAMPVYDSSLVDSQATVNQIAAANGKQPNDLFFTFTCNERDTPGVRRLFRWVESEEALVEFKNHFFSGELEDDIGRRKTFSEQENIAAKEALQMSAASTLLRIWCEFVDVFLAYLKTGKDSPFRSVCGGLEA